MSIKASDLFQAYSENNIPAEKGTIIIVQVNSFTHYSRIQIISYYNATNIYHSEKGLTFMAHAKKIFILVEPETYEHKTREPVSRDDHERIPHRFDELTAIKAKTNARIMISSKPVLEYSSFSINRSNGEDCAFIFFDTDNISFVLRQFIEKTLIHESLIPSDDAQRAVQAIQPLLEDCREWNY
ncbi:MAG: hypothetical protein JW881_00940 [Spirochaetales bacterium]|nr:hypothetical protein [Spirochaetales bacterium]